MATYLLVWNPKRWRWENLDESVEEVKRKGFCLERWSVGASKQIRKGDRLFLIRLGESPRGIMGSGIAISDFYESPHWNIGKRAEGKTARFVDLHFDNLLNPEKELILEREELDKGILVGMHWDSQSSGIRVHDDVAIALEKEWARLLETEGRQVPSADPLAIEGTKTEAIRYVRHRDRRLRNRALKESGGVCSVCEVDFAQVLNGDGVRVLQVHHRKQLASSDAPRITRLTDLAVVCANCHVLIHANLKEALSVEDLKRRLSRDRTSFGDKE